jgi:hypothetical protein
MTITDEEKQILELEELLLKASNAHEMCWCKVPIKISNWVHEKHCAEIRKYFFEDKKRPTHP